MQEVDRAPRGHRAATVAAMIVVAIVAVFQTSVIFLGLAAHRDAAHMIDISGLQRSRAQALSYLAVSLRGTKADIPARAEIDRTVAAMLETRAEIFRTPKYLTGPVDHHGHTPLSLQSDAFIALVRNIERHPGEPIALARLWRARPAMAAAYDRSVEFRVAVTQTDDAKLMGALLIGLCLQIGAMAAAWFAIVAPAERRADRFLAELRGVRRELESTFDGNPDGIAVYDRNGYLIRVNAARAQFIGRPPEELVGAHYADVVDPRFSSLSVDAFTRALKGETVRFDSSLIAYDGSLVDISVAAVPRIIDDEVVGVNIVSRDMRELRAAEAANVEQTQRLADLYEIASSHGRTTNEMLTSAIDLVTHRLGYDLGVITEISDDIVTVAALSGTPRGVAVGDTQPFRTALARFAVHAQDYYEEHDFTPSLHASGAAGHAWGSVSGMKISIGGLLYGTIGFASRANRNRDLSAGDASFMRLSCALLGTIIERGRQIRKLDALAFSDSLTELPNRARFVKALEEAIESKVPFALHYVDLDHFKEINDGFGHATGDTVLQVAARRLQESTRPSDIVVRLGGDEFAIVQMGASTYEAARMVAARVVEALGVPIETDGASHTVGASVGVALFPDDAGTGQSLIKAADAALYDAKESGRRRYAFVANRVDRHKAS